MSWPKKNSYKEFDKEKKIPAAPNFSTPPPITFLMVRPLHEVASCVILFVVARFCHVSVLRRKLSHQLTYVQQKYVLPGGHLGIFWVGMCCSITVCLLTH